MMTTYAPNGMEWLPTSETPLLDAALAYAEHDFRIHPVWYLRNGRCACGKSDCKPGKHPIGNGWQKKSSTDVDVVRDARRAHPQANVGMAMGGKARIITVDIDGQKGRDSLRKLENEHGDIPETLTSRSGRADGGEHRIFFVPMRLDIGRIKNRSGTNNLDGIDTRGENGQIVVAPSVHESGSKYEWVKRVPIAEIPGWLFEAIATPLELDRRAGAGSAPVSAPVVNLANKYISRVIENACRDIANAPSGQRNSLLFAKSATVFEYCIGAGFSQETAWTELADAGRACGLPAGEVESTLNKSWRTAQNNPRTVPPPRTASPSPAVAAAAPLASSEAPSRAWEADLTRTLEGVVKKNLANVTTILSCDPRWRDVIAYDAFGEAVITTRLPPMRPQDAPQRRAETSDWTDEDSIRTVNWLSSEWSLDVTVSVVDQAVMAIAQRKEVHVVRDYLRGLVWDGVPRLDTMLVKYFDAADTEYSRGISARWMISAVARVEQPGCQADCAIILESEQGKGKSTGLEILASRTWFADTGVVIGDKDSYQSLRRKWIYELAELAALRKARVETVKGYLSARSDNYRASFGKRNRDYLRQNIFAGTTNQRHYLEDRTGNRRFWPVRCGNRDVDRDALARDRDQLWAEAYARYVAGEKWHANTPEFRALCESEQAERVHEDPWESLISTWLEAPWVTVFDGVDGGVKRHLLNISSGVTSTEVLLGAIRKKPGEISRGDEMRVGEAMRALGYETVRRRDSVSRVRRYVKVGPVGPQVGPPQTLEIHSESEVVQLAQPNMESVAKKTEWSGSEPPKPPNEVGPVGPPHEFFTIDDL